MPKYFFNLLDDRTIEDPDGTDLPDLVSARRHAIQVAKELKHNSHGMLGKGWASWTMRVNDEKGTQLFVFALAETTNGNGGAK
jgi:hypothetical protein